MNILFSIVPIALTALPVFADFDATQLVAAARRQVGATVGYDPAYRKLTYPGGDVPIETGVCCDVVIRALRQQNVDLQQRVHEDMKVHFTRYPANWGLKAPDSNAVTGSSMPRQASVPAGVPRTASPGSAEGRVLRGGPP